MERIRLSGLLNIATYTVTLYHSELPSRSPILRSLTEITPGDYETDLPTEEMVFGGYALLFENAGREVARILFSYDGSNLEPAIAYDNYVILRVLGYANPDTANRNTFLAHTPDVRRAVTALQTVTDTQLRPYDRIRVSEIVKTLAKLDEQIANALADSAIVQTCNTTMDWRSHLKLLREQAHYLLTDLAYIYGIPLARSRYQSQKSTHTMQYQ